MIQLTPFLSKLKREIADRKCCLHFVIFEIRAMKFKTDLFYDIIFRKLTLYKEIKLFITNLLRDLSCASLLRDLIYPRKALSQYIRQFIADL